MGFGLPPYAFYYPTTCIFLWLIKLLLSLASLLVLYLQHLLQFVCRRLAKSALVLIPLFGVPYMLFLGAQYYYIDGKLELAKLYFEMTFNSFNVSEYCIALLRLQALLNNIKGSTVIWATNNLGDSQLGDTPTGRQPTGRHFSVNWATQLWLLRGQCRKCNILTVLKVKGKGTV